MTRLMVYRSLFCLNGWCNIAYAEILCAIIQALPDSVETPVSTRSYSYKTEWEITIVDGS